ncbi:unnamed protein product [Caenorhabditis nigoni]
MAKEGIRSDDEEDEAFLKEEVNRTIQDQRAAADILKEDVNLQMELLEWNQEHSKEKPNELGPGILEASEPVESSSPASTASLEDVAFPESSSNALDDVNPGIQNPMDTPSPMRPASEDGVSNVLEDSNKNVLEENEGDDGELSKICKMREIDAGNFEDLGVSAAGKAVEADELSRNLLSGIPMETEDFTREASEVQNQEEEEFIDVEGIGDEEDFPKTSENSGPSNEFEAMRVENMAIALTIPKGPLED